MKLFSHHGSFPVFPAQTGKTIFILLVPVLVACGRKSPQYWPDHKSHFKNIRWEISVADSSKVLKTQDGSWMLPEPDPNCPISVTSVRHRKPVVSEFEKYLGRVDQEVVQGEDEDRVEFYRFDHGHLCLLGYTTSDSSRALVFYNPPLMLWPQSFQSVPLLRESSGTTQYLNKVTGQIEKGQKSHIKFEALKQGSLVLGSATVDAFFCTLRFSMDKTVAFGETDLIVPDAIMVENRMLLVENIGPVLEWGVRSREATNAGRNSREDGPHDPLRMELERESFIEVVLNRT